MMKDLIEAAEKWDKPAGLWWTRTNADEMMDDTEIKTSTRQHNCRSRRSSRFWMHLLSGREDAGQLGRDVFECKQKKGGAS